MSWRERGIVREWVKELRERERETRKAKNDKLRKIAVKGGY